MEKGKIKVYHLAEISSDAAAFGIKSASLYFDGNIAVWRLSMDYGGYIGSKYNIASPKDLWLMDVIKNAEEDILIGTEKEYDGVYCHLKMAANDWKQVREIARIRKIHWLDAPYRFLVDKNIEVFVRSESMKPSDFIFTISLHHEGIIRTSGDLISHILRDDYLRFDDFLYKIGLAPDEMTAYIDLRKSAGKEINRFLQEPEKFDGHLVSKKILFAWGDKIIVELDKLSVKIYESGDDYDIVCTTNNLYPHGGYVNFPYATWYARKSELENKIKEAIKTSRR